MGKSNSVITVSETQLAPCRINFNGTDLGGTLNNCVILMEYAKSPIKVDQWGSTIADQSNSGFNATVKTTIAQVRGMDTLVKAIPGLRDTTVVADRVLDWMNLVGCRDSSIASLLTLHPLDLLDTDKSVDYNFFKAAPTEATSVTIGPEEQSGMEITWQILPDDTEGQDLIKFMRLGDAAVVVP